MTAPLGWSAQQRRARGSSPSKPLLALGFGGARSAFGVGFVGNVGLLHEIVEDLSSKDITGESLDPARLDNVSPQFVGGLARALGQALDLLVELAPGDVHVFGLGDLVQEEVDSDGALGGPPLGDAQ